MANDAHADHEAAGWIFRFGDPLVTQLRVDYSFTLVLGGGALVVLAEPFDLGRGGSTVRLSPGESGFEISEALPLFNSRIEAIQARASGELHIEFSGDVTAEVAVNPHYENWQIVMPDGEEWIGTPGGGVHHIVAP